MREREYIQILNFCPKKSKPTGGVAPSWSESVTKHHAPFLLLAKKVVAFELTGLAQSRLATLARTIPVKTTVVALAGLAQSKQAALPRTSPV